MAKETIVVVVGAGASVKAGIVGTVGLTDTAKKALPRVLQLGAVHLPSRHAAYLRHDRPAYVADILDQALQADYGANYDFEILLHAIEELETFVGPRYNPDGRSDVETPVLGSFADLMQRFQSLDDESMLDAARLAVLEAIHQRVGFDCFSTKGNPTYAPARDQLERIFEALASRYRLVVIDFNYDDIIDDIPGVTWHDGFITSLSPYTCTMFSPDGWAAILGDEDVHLLLHVHGSVRFGYQPFAVKTYVNARFAEPAKYNTALDAQGSLSGRGMSGTMIAGRVEDASYIISGVGKAGKVTYNARPYGYYFRTIMEMLPRTKRLLVLGYGWRDYHVNTWINEYISLHPNRRSAVVTRRTGDMVGDFNLEYKALALLASPETWIRMESSAYARWPDELAAGHPSRFKIDANFAIAPEGFIMDPADEAALISFMTV